MSQHRGFQQVPQDVALLWRLATTPAGFQPGTSRTPNVHLTTRPYRYYADTYCTCLRYYIRSNTMSHITFKMCQFVLIIHLKEYHYGLESCYGVLQLTYTTYQNLCPADHFFGWLLMSQDISPTWIVLLKSIYWIIQVFFSHFPCLKTVLWFDSLCLFPIFLNFLNYLFSCQTYIFRESKFLMFFIFPSGLLHLLLLEENARANPDVRIRPLTHASVDRAHQAESVGRNSSLSILIAIRRSPNLWVKISGEITSFEISRKIRFNFKKRISS
jgi:hypothetical protein